jgi:hypothetical protein
MSKINYIFLSILCVSAIACEKEQDPYIGVGSATMNGQEWKVEITATSNPQAKTKDTLFISLHHKDGDGIVRQALSFDNIPLILQKNKIDSISKIRSSTLIKSCIFFYFLADGDVGGDNYFVNRNRKSNYITISEINGNRIKGEFNAVLYRDTTFKKVVTSSPDSLVFNGGKFEVLVKK